MSEHDLHPISCKAAVFSEDGSRMIVMNYSRNPARTTRGLPGGHIDKGECPDQTMAREFIEEVGLLNIEFKRASFFTHPNGKIILGYTAVIAYQELPTAPNPDKEIAFWAKMKDIRSGKVDLAHYQEFALSAACDRLAL